VNLRGDSTCVNAEQVAMSSAMALDFWMPELWRQGAEVLRVGEVAVDVLARVFSHLDSFKDMAKYGAPCCRCSRAP
jgi:hypothetical protein